jgi:hypothetical protein
MSSGSFQVVSVAVYILKNLQYRRLLTRAEELYMQVKFPYCSTVGVASSCISGPASAYLCCGSWVCSNDLDWKLLLGVPIC